MPVRKKDTQQALKLLEEYRAKLSQTEDLQLRHSIERVITVFQSSLFQALIDIQEFYEVTLQEKQDEFTKPSEAAEPSLPSPPVNQWDITSVPSTSATAETQPSSLTPTSEWFSQENWLNLCFAQMGRKSKECLMVETAGVCDSAYCLLIANLLKNKKQETMMQQAVLN
ncbi:hypothetical protein MHYP_G00333990 [Metynnis hypsauchen]